MLFESKDYFQEGKLDYDLVLNDFPWLLERNKKCILSPDSDGFLSGLLMSHFLDWKIVGYYDGKVMAKTPGTKIDDVVFLDMEIFRKNIKSIGHHMVLNNKRNVPINWDNYANCIQLNNLVGFDAKNDFRSKYPFGTIHFLLAILKTRIDGINLSHESISSLLYTDGTFKNIFNFPENSLNWLDYLDAKSPQNPLNKVFFNNAYSISSLMIDLQEYFKSISKFGKNSDKLKISNSKGEPQNLIAEGTSNFSIVDEEKNKVKNFLTFLALKTGWLFDENKWTFSNLKVYKFTKQITNKINKSVYDSISSNAFSWAITGTTTIEYTLEGPNYLSEVD